MSITVNHNMQALGIQGRLNEATKRMNTAMERMASGSRINSSKDDAAGLAVSTTLENTISSSKVASDNVGIGSDLLSTTEGTLDVIAQNLARIRDLTEQASNGTYSTDDRLAIGSEIRKRIEAIDNLAKSSTFNGINLLSDTSPASTAGITLQVGTGADATDNLNLSSDIFAKIDMATDLTGLAATIESATSKPSEIAAFLDTIDGKVTDITERVTKIGAFQNQLEAVANGLTVQQNNLTSALSTIKDADIAEESASYVQSQILQQASASLLVQANSSPQIALTLIKG